MTWPMVKLGGVTERVNYGLTASAKVDDEGPRFLRITDMQDDTVDWNTVPSCECSAKEFEDNQLFVGDIVFARTGATTGKSYLIKHLPKPSVFASYLIRVRPTNEVDSKYLAYFFKSPQYWNQITAMANGAAQPGVNSSKLKELEIPLPPLAEQQRIAAILDKADAIRRKRQQAIQLADEFLRAVFLDMFGDPTAQGWDWATVEEFADSAKGSMRTGPFGSDLKHSEFVDSGVAVLGIDNAVQNRFAWGKERFITNEKYEKLKRYTVKAGDVIITIMGTCGRCAVVPNDIPLAVNTKHLCCITLDRSKCLPEFLHSYFLMHPTSKEYLGIRAKGAIMDGLNLGMIKEMPIPVVPVDIQTKYVDISKAVNRSLNNLNLASQGETDLFSSLSQKAFKGEL